MDLKEFITETMNGIIEATNDLQKQWHAEDVIVNPPVDSKHTELYEKGSGSHVFRPIQTVKFDVAVTAASEKAGEGKASLKVLSAELGAEGGVKKQDQQVSRVQFSIPLTLRASEVEKEHHAERDRRESTLARKSVRRKPPVA